LAAIVFPFVQDAVGMLTNLIIGNAGNICGKVSQPPLPDVRMQMGLELRPYVFVASDDQPLEIAFFKSVLKPLGDIFKVVHGIIFEATLGVTAIVAAKTVAASAPGQIVEDTFAFRNLVQTQIKEAGTFAIH